MKFWDLAGARNLKLRHCLDGWGFALDPAGEVTVLPDPLAD